MSSSPVRRLLAMLPVALTVGCGYTVGSRGAVRALSVAPVSGSVIDIDAAALVDGAVREAVARSPGVRLAAAGEGERQLEVELVATDSPLIAFSDPGHRAAQYRAEIRVRGRLRDASGRVVWTSDIIAADAGNISPAGRLEVLDGTRRAALARAAQLAAERLVASLP